MKKIFIEIGFWFLKLGGWNVEVVKLIASMPQVEIGLLEYARVLTRVLNKDCSHGTSGEYKRHLAFAALQKKFPNFTKRQISMAIEIALG